MRVTELVVVGAVAELSNPDTAVPKASNFATKRGSVFVYTLAAPSIVVPTGTVVSRLKATVAMSPAGISATLSKIRIWWVPGGAVSVATMIFGSGRAAPFGPTAVPGR